MRIFSGLEACVMQSAEAVVDILRARGRRGLPCDELYRQLFNPALFLMAWGRIYANDGAMTPGACGETADGMSLAKIGRIIDSLRHERYRFQPARRVYIPKRNGKLRPLGIPTMTDRAMQALYLLALEPISETTADRNSYGFRPERSTADAIEQCFKSLALRTSAQACRNALPLSTVDLLPAVTPSLGLRPVSAGIMRMRV